MTQRRYRIIRISRDLLLSLLQLPEGTRVVDFSRDAYFSFDQFGLKVEHPSFDPVEDGALVPELMPTYKAATVYGPVTQHRFAGWEDAHQSVTDNDPLKRPS